MKRFLRTYIGKFILFTLCLLSLCVFAGSVAGSILFYDFDFYGRTEQQIFDDRVENKLKDLGEDVLWSALTNETLDDVSANVLYRIENDQGHLLAVSETTYDGKFTYAYRFASLKREDIVTDVFFYNDLEEAAAPEVEHMEFYRVYMEFREGMPQRDFYRTQYKLVHFGYSLRYGIYGISAGSLVLAVLSYIGLLCVSGRRKNSAELHPGKCCRLPLEIMLGLIALLVGFILFVLFQLESLMFLVGGILAYILLTCVFIGLSMQLAVRVKSGTLFTNTLFYRIPFVWRTGLVLLILSFVEVLIFTLYMHEPRGLLCWWIVEKVLVVPLILYMAYHLRKLYKSGAALASGDLAYHTDTTGMFADFKKHGEHLNSIAAGMERAVDEKMRSEQLKTELITNVSHDIKTPLTSIINYAGLIERTPCAHQQIQEYAQVLVRQSERLKRLLEDLVEASKATTGNLEIHLTPCDAAVFLTQISGEYEDKFKERELTLVVSCPTEPVYIQADGQKLQRVFDNLMNNIYKYSLPGTRVYLSLESDETEVVILLKNTSEKALNIPGAELMERFVRGDSSRNTEGNGLGLAIAESLVKLQNGQMTISIDGDLFKVTLRFPAQF